MDAQSAPPTEPNEASAVAAGTCGGDDAHWSRERIERQQAVLDRFVEIGLEMAEIGLVAARVMASGVMAPADAAPADDASADGQPEAQARPTAPPNPVRALTSLALAHDRVARAVRQTIDLQSTLTGKLERVERIEAYAVGEAAREAAAARARDLRAADHLRGATVQLIIDRIATAEYPGDAEAVRRKVEQACERLRDRERFGDLLSRPISEAVSHLCNSLGLRADWASLSEEAWAREEIAGGRIGAPLAAAMAGWKESGAASKATPKPLSKAGRSKFARHASDAPVERTEIPESSEPQQAPAPTVPPFSAEPALKESVRHEPVFEPASPPLPSYPARALEPEPNWLPGEAPPNRRRTLRPPPASPYWRSG